MNQWPDGTFKTTRNAFNWQGGKSQTITPYMSAAFTKAQRQNKQKLSIHGLSAKGDELITKFAARHGGAYSKAVAK